MKKSMFILLAAFMLQAFMVSGAFAKDILKSGESLGKDTANPMLISSDGRFTLVMQTDGNLVLYMAGRALWHTHTYGQWTLDYDPYGQIWFRIYPDKLQLYISGWLEIRDNTESGRFWQADTKEWMKRHYGSLGLPTPTNLIGDTLIVQNDGNVVLYDTKSGTWKPVWATNTYGH